jgi:hypothetical protein
MVTVNIVPVNTPAYTVDDSGAVHIVLKDTANTYADGSNPQRDFIVIPKAQTMVALNKALLLAKEEAIDYFRKEAEAIAYRALVLLGMSQVTIPGVIFSGDPAGYEKIEKIGVNKDEIIIADSIEVQVITPEIFEVTASVIGKDQDRAQAKRVKVQWNKNSGLDECRDRLISAFNNTKATPEDAVRAQLKQGIGTVIPE